MTSTPRFQRPDVLVLAGGGILGEAWMSGLLAGIEDASGVDFSDVESFVGTSAGSIVASALVAGVALRRPRGEAHHNGSVAQADGAGDATRSRTAVEIARAAVRAAARPLVPLAPRALSLSEPGGALLRALLLSQIADGTRTLDDLQASVARSGARFDGRLRIVCVDRKSGKRVVFGAPDARPATVGEAVAASCAIPGVFRPVWINGRAHVDGGAWSFTNVDVAPAGRDAYVLCLNPSAGLTVPPGSPLAAMRVAARAAEAIETLVVQRRGARVLTVAPDAAACAAMGRDLMNPRPRASVLASAYRQGQALAAQ